MNTLHRLALTFLLLLTPESLGAPVSPPPHTCRWSFPGGTPASSTSCAPPRVRYSTLGPKAVTLTVCAAGPGGRCTSIIKIVTVQDPRPFVSGITTDPQDLYAGDTVRLTATVSGRPPFTWLWTLPGTASSRANPTLLPTARLAPGLLTVRVRATNASGSATRTAALRLQDPRPVLTGLSLSSTSPAVGTVLTASPFVTGRPPLVFAWSLDGHRLSTDRTLSWLVADVAAGRHTLALAVSNASGAASLDRTLTIQQPLIADFRPVCPGLLCLFPVGTPVAFELVLDPSAHPIGFDYDWTGTGPFTESSTIPVDHHVYSAAGNYQPRVRVTTALGSEVCRSSQFLLVTR